MNEGLDSVLAPSGGDSTLVQPPFASRASSSRHENGRGSPGMAWLSERCLHRHPCLCGESLQSCPTLCTPWTVTCQAPPSTGILQAGIRGWVAMPSPIVVSIFLVRGSVTFLFHREVCDPRDVKNWGKPLTHPSDEDRGAILVASPTNLF